MPASSYWYNHIWLQLCLTGYQHFNIDSLTYFCQYFHWYWTIIQKWPFQYCSMKTETRQQFLSIQLSVLYFWLSIHLLRTFSLFMEVLRDLKCKQCKTANAISSKSVPPIERSTFMWHLSTFISIHWTLDIYLPTAIQTHANLWRYSNGDCQGKFGYIINCILVPYQRLFLIQKKNVNFAT